MCSVPAALPGDGAGGALRLRPASSGPLVCCIIVHFVWKTSRLVTLEPTRLVPLFYPIPPPERPLISLVSENSMPVHLL